MKYLVDGHNLIGALRDMSLSQADDEQELMLRLKRFCLTAGSHRIEVFFDNASPGAANPLRMGPVTAFFIRPGTPADSAIEQRISKLGRSVREWTVVSNDTRVTNAARHAHAAVLSATQFASLLYLMKQAHPASQEKDEEQPLSSQEVDEWEQLFKQGRPKKLR